MLILKFIILHIFYIFILFFKNKFQKLDNTDIFFYLKHLN